MSSLLHSLVEVSRYDGAVNFEARVQQTHEDVMHEYKPQPEPEPGVALGWLGLRAWA